MAAPPTTSPQLGARISETVELLAGITGLAAYITLIGGVREWSRIAAAGLPTDQALPALDPGALVASGLQGFMLAPLAFATILVVLRLGARSARSRDAERTLKVVRRSWLVATQLILASVAAVYGAMLALLVAVLFYALEDWSPRAAAFAVVVLAPVFMLLVGLVAEQAARREQGTSAGLPRVCRAPRNAIVTWGLVLATTATAGVVFLAYGVYADESWARFIGLSAMTVAIAGLLLALGGSRATARLTRRSSAAATASTRRPRRR